MTRRYAPDASDQELLAMPGVLAGTPRDVADKVLWLRDTYGITYFTVMFRQADYFAKAISELR